MSKIKVLHIISKMASGGAEKLLVDTLPLYNTEDIGVDLLVLNGEKTPFLDYLEQNSDVEVFTAGKTTEYNPFYIFKIIPYLKKYDIIQVHLFPTLYWVAVAKVLTKSRSRIIFTEHSTNNKRRELRFSKQIEKKIYNRYDKYVTIAEDVDKNLKNFIGGNKNKFQMIKNGVDVSKFANAKPIDNYQFFPKDSKIVLQVSRFKPAKDHTTLFKALARLPVNVKLLLVGDGPLLTDYKTLVEKLEIQDRVQFLGIRTDVPQIMKMVDIVVLSSHYEGLSLASIEGMSCGKPFVSSRVPGLENVVQNAGLLFKKGDDKELADIIQNLLNDQNLYDQTVRNCQKRAELYDVSLMVQNHQNLYRELKDS